MEEIERVQEHIAFHHNDQNRRLEDIERSLWRDLIEAQENEVRQVRYEPQIAMSIDTPIAERSRELMFHLNRAREREKMHTMQISAYQFLNGYYNVISRTES